MTFSNNVKKDLLDAYNGYCGNEGCPKVATSIHHLLPQTKNNKKKYPHFLHSPFNGIPLCQYCHDNFPHKYRINDKLAQVYEDFLNEGV